MYTQEMGFALVAEMMFKSMKSKALIGHNPMMDMLYFYNQFIAPLPSTYTTFIQSWTKLFPITYDTKVLAFKNVDMFPSSILGSIFK